MSAQRRRCVSILSLEIVKDLRIKGSARIFNCDDPDHRDLLENRGLEALKSAIGDNKVIFIDEGQKLSTIGQTLKLLADYFKKSIQIIVTGSSTMNLLDKTQEALTGRKRVYSLYPISLEEVVLKGNLDKKKLEILLVFGSYPHVVAAQKKRKQDRYFERIKDKLSLSGCF